MNEFMLQGISMLVNKQGDPCARCRENEGTEPIHDDESIEFWLCDICEHLIEWQ